LTHALIEEICDLEYNGQSGALNESYADIFGVMFENYIHKKYMTLGWELGSECNLLLRNMANPSQCNQPETIREMYMGNQDNGGVHINSGIPNHTFYCFTNIIGLEASFILFYKTLIQLHKYSTFIDFCIKLEQNCRRDTNESEFIRLKDVLEYHFYR
jgi:Zn-dependent metalloprotease